LADWKADRVAMPRLPVHTETLLDLFKRQQTHGEAGVRMCFHPELLAPLSLRDQPYHYCAVAGRPELAALLYARSIPLARDMTVATFSAGGVGGDTVWRKGLTLAPSEAALMAGHAKTAQVLEHIERGVPLEWNRSVHSRFPEDFRTEARDLVAGLAGAGWFAALPGPVRVSVVDTAVAGLARQRVWGELDAGFWEGLAGAGGELGEELLGPGCGASAINSLVKHWGQRDAKRVTRSLQAPQYQFRVAAGQEEGGRGLFPPGRTVRRAFWGLLSKASVLLVARSLLLRCGRRGQRARAPPPSNVRTSALCLLASLLQVAAVA